MAFLARWLFPVQLCNFRGRTSGDQRSSRVYSNNSSVDIQEEQTKELKLKSFKCSSYLCGSHHSRGERIWSSHCLHLRFAVTSCGFLSQPTDEE